MTAQAVGSPSATSTSPKSAANVAAKDPAATPFEHQLHAARQNGNPAPKDHADTHEARTKQGRDTGRDHRSESSSASSDARHSHDDKVRLDSSRADTSDKSDPGSGSSPPAAANASAPSTVNTAPATAVEAGAASSDAAVVKKDAQVDEQAATALVSAMLALIGPATGKALTLGAAGGAAISAKSVATDAAAAAMLQSGDVVTTVATANLASTALPALPILPARMFAADGLSLDMKKGADVSTRVDAAANLMLAPATVAAPATPVSVPISAPVGSHGFAQELGQQVAWFVGQDIKQARIRLHPEELGSLDLKISVNHGRVDVVFHAQHPGAVTAVQQSLPQLDQMLAQHGLSLGNTEVGQHDRDDQRGRADDGGQVSDAADVQGSGLITPLGQLGLLDAFA